MIRTGTVLACAALAALPGLARAETAAPASAVVEADRAYAAAVKAHGEWSALRAVSVPQSEMFVPRRVRVLDFGRNLPDPPHGTRWRAQQAWISCDGTAGVTFGRWSIPHQRQRGWYEAVWARAQDGTYRMLLHHGGTQRRNLFARPGLKGQQASCAGRPPLALAAPAEGVDLKFGAAHDQTLLWSSAVDAQGALRIAVSLWDGQRHVSVLEDVAPAGAAR